MDVNNILAQLFGQKQHMPWNQQYPIPRYGQASPGMTQQQFEQKRAQNAAENQRLRQLQQTDPDAARRYAEADQRAYLEKRKMELEKKKLAVEDLKLSQQLQELLAEDEDTESVDGAE